MNKETQEILRRPFDDKQVSTFPNNAGQKSGLPYVGHAATTDRLLLADPEWNWEPLSFDDSGQPLMDERGGMWIKLTVGGVTRLGYGHADGKKGGDAIKEVIGDAIRNAAMRFGVALDLWHKSGDLFLDPEEEERKNRKVSESQAKLLRTELALRDIDQDKFTRFLSARFKAASFDDLPACEFDLVMEQIQRKPLKEEAKP